jgi:UDP-glucose 4-epimerase
MTTLVTGAGIVGCHTARLLAARGEPVILLDIAPRRAAIAALLGDAPVDIVVGDVTDYVALKQLARDRQVRRIVHTAALLPAAIRREPRRGYAVNVLGTMNMLELARDEGLGRVVFASSVSVGFSTFGRFAGAAFPENFDMRMASELPTSLYAASKLAAEHCAEAYRATYGVDAIALRYASVFGVWPGGATSAPCQLVTALVEAGRAGRKLVLDEPRLVWGGRDEFVDARDCARANLAALDAPAPARRAYNIATGAWHTLDEVVATVRAVFPALVVERRIEARGGLAGFPFERPAPSDISAAAAELGFRAAYGLSETVRFCAESASPPEV